MEEERGPEAARQAAANMPSDAPGTGDAAAVASLGEASAAVLRPAVAAGPELAGGRRGGDLHERDPGPAAGARRRVRHGACPAGREYRHSDRAGAAEQRPSGAELPVGAGEAVEAVLAAAPPALEAPPASAEAASRAGHTDRPGGATLPAGHRRPARPGGATGARLGEYAPLWPGRPGRRVTRWAVAQCRRRGERDRQPRSRQELGPVPGRPTGRPRLAPGRLRRWPSRTS